MKIVWVPFWNVFYHLWVWLQNTGAKETLEKQMNSTPPPLPLNHPQSNSLPKSCWVCMHILKHCCVDTLFCVWFDFYRLLWSNSINHKCWENTLKLLRTNTPWEWREKFTRNAIYTRSLNHMTTSSFQRIKCLGFETAASDHKAWTSFMKNLWVQIWKVATIFSWSVWCRNKRWIDFFRACVKFVHCFVFWFVSYPSVLLSPLTQKNDN